MDLNSYRYTRNQRRRTLRARLANSVRAQDPDLARSIENFNAKWFSIRPGKITNQSSEDSTEVYIYEEIDWFWGLSADVFVQELNEITTSNIDVRLNSPGGDVFDSIAIYNALVKHPANVTVYVDSLAASGASIIAMSGDKIVMMVGSQMMIHDAMGIEIGNAAQLREYAEFLDKQSDNISTIYAARAGGEASDWRNMMLAETWMFAEEAVESGLADEVYSKPTTAETNEDGEESEEEGTETEPQEQEGDEEQAPPMPPGEDEEAESLDDVLDKLRHSLANRGWKYAGRNRAPVPPTHNNVDLPFLYSDAALEKFVQAMSRNR